MTLGCGLLGVSLLWFLTTRFPSQNRGAILWGIASAMVFALILWAAITPAFRRLSAYPLDLGNFLYAGFLAGAVTGEIRFRSLLRESSVPRSAIERKQDFYILALMTWAVILKVFGCFELVTIPAGRPVPEVGAHLFMFLSVAVWVPEVCKHLWKSNANPALYVLLACAAGVLLPPVIGCVLYFPAVILMYMGLPPLASNLLWGITFLRVSGIWQPVLLLVPGLTWGTIVALCRWNYLQVEKSNLPVKVPLDKL